MNALDNLQYILFQIEQLIKSDEGIRKLLYYTTTDALTKTDIDQSLISDRIFFSPVFDNTKEPFNKATFITITWTRIVDEDDEALINGVIRINVMVELAN